MTIDDRGDSGGAYDPIVAGFDAAEPPHNTMPARSIRPALSLAAEVVSPTIWEGQPVPDREWIVEDWIPRGEVTALYGDGGTGKTLLAQQLITACAVGKNWLGLNTHSCTALGVFCEDTKEELHRRQDAINRAYDCSMSDLEESHLLPRHSRDNFMMGFEGDSNGVTTDFYASVYQYARNVGASLIVLDTIAQIFAGNENNRTQVTAFLATCAGRLAADLNAAVVLCGHPSSSGMRDGAGFSGSTGWNASLRSRLYLSRSDLDEGSIPQDNRRMLSKRKSNYSSAGDTVDVEWRDGCILPLDQPFGVFAHIEQHNVEQAFVAGLKELAKQGRHCSDAANAANFAPKMIRTLPQYRKHRQGDLRDAMTRLFNAGRLVMDVKHSGGKTRSMVVRDEL